MAAGMFVLKVKQKLIAISVNRCHINVSCYIKPTDMYLHSARKQINSLILSSDLDTSKVNHVTLGTWLPLLCHLVKNTSSL